MFKELKGNMLIPQHAGNLKKEIKTIKKRINPRV